MFWEKRMQEQMVFGWVNRFFSCEIADFSGWTGHFGQPQVWVSMHLTRLGDAFHPREDL